jgi:hypothetical protein
VQPKSSAQRAFIAKVLERVVKVEEHGDLTHVFAQLPGRRIILLCVDRRTIPDYASALHYARQQVARKYVAELATIAQPRP